VVFLPKTKGVRAERELANILWSKGFAVIRGPASGAGVRKRFQPDLVAMKAGKILVIEVKRTSSLPVYLRSEQVVGLSEFARRAGGIAYIAVKDKNKGWRFFKIDEVKTTKGGGFKVEGEGLPLENFLSEVLSIRKITDFI
jgi:Holliday junction resolvase